MYFTASWICRPGFDELTNPNVGTTVAFGAPKIGVLVRLMNSARSRIDEPSVTENRLDTLRSAVFNPGPRKEPAPQLPNVPAAGSAHRAGIKN